MTTQASLLGGILSTRQKRELLGLLFARLPGDATLQYELQQLLQAARIAEDDRNRPWKMSSRSRRGLRRRASASRVSCERTSG
jgi:hypothetical protein